MNARKHLTMSFALAALAVGLTTTHASAQSALTGTFELPGAVYWGETLLQPGRYSIWLSSGWRDGVVAIHLTGKGVMETILAISSPERASRRNYLEVADLEGTHVVRAFDAGILGKSFAFRLSKNARNKALRASARPAIKVPLSSGAGS